MIATVGNSGRSTAPHLHYEILLHNRRIDPLKYVINSGLTP
jgi:murein DD-endopeptidase MepM/ murein hydrolase activator NlpD